MKHQKIEAKLKGYVFKYIVLSKKKKQKQIIQFTMTKYDEVAAKLFRRLRIFSVLTIFDLKLR